MTPLQKITLRLESMEKITEMMLTAIDKQNAAIGAIHAVLDTTNDNKIVIPH